MNICQVFHRFEILLEFFAKNWPKIQKNYELCISKGFTGKRIYQKFSRNINENLQFLEKFSYIVTEFLIFMKPI